MDVQLDTPLVTVILDDGREFTVRVLNADYILWDRTAAKHGWPAIQKAPFTWLTFVAWAALRRGNLIPLEWTWDEFSEVRCLQVRNAEDKAGQNGLAAVDPTLAEAAPA